MNRIITDNEQVFNAKHFEERADRVCLYTPLEDGIEQLIASVEGSEHIGYYTKDENDEDKLVCSVAGAWKFSGIYDCGDTYRVEFKKTDDLAARVAVLEEENAELKAALLDTQEALAEFVEGTDGAEDSAAEPAEAEEGTEEDGEQND